MNMRRYRFALGYLTVWTFVGAAVATAAESEEEWKTKYPWNLSLGGGWKDFEGDEVVNDSSFVSCQVEYDYPSRWTVMGVLAYYPTIDGHVSTDPAGHRTNRLLESAGVESTEAISFSIEGLYHVRAGSEGLDPYLVASAGIMHYFDDFSSVDSADPMLTTGAGLLYHMTRKWAVRADARMLLTFSGETQANSFFTFGLVYKLTP